MRTILKTLKTMRGPTSIRLVAIGTGLTSRGIMINAYIIPPKHLTQLNNKCYATMCRAFTMSNIRSTTVQRPVFSSTVSSNTRLFSSLFDDNNNNNNKKKKGLLSKLANKAKSFVPTRWLSEKDVEKQASIERSRLARNEINDSITTMLKDAPLGIRMMGKLIIPIVSKLAQTIREQGQIMNDVLNEAKELIINDDKAVSVLGSSIKVGSPFSQSSSSTSINGRSTTKIQTSFPVQGSLQSGTASVVSAVTGDNPPKIESLTLDVSGRVYSIGLIKSAGGPDVFSGKTSVVGKNMARKGDIIDAEFVDK